MNNLIDLKRLQHLLLLAEELHFSKAALRANLTQTAFSRSIQTLERDIALRLFDRGTRSVALTASGMQVVALARELLNQAGHLQLEVAELSNGQSGRLSFGVSQLVPADLLETLVAQLQPAVAHVHLDIEVNHWQTLSELLLSEQIEFFVAYAEPLAADARFQLRALSAQPVSLFCRAGHPLLHAQPFSVPLLLRYPWACVRFDPALAEPVCRVLGLKTQQLPIRLNCNDLSLLRRRALHGDYLLLTWRHWLEDDLRAGNIVDLQAAVTLRASPLALSLPCSLVQLAGRSLSPLARKAVAHLLEVVGSA